MSLTSLINAIPSAQLLSVVVVLAFVGTAVTALFLHPVIAAGATVSPIVAEWPTMLMTSMFAAVLHQSVKLYKGGAAEVDQQ